MSFSNLRTKTKILIGACPPLVLMAALGIATIFMLNSIMTTNRWVNHTAHVLAEASEIVGSAVNMETGMRGFLLAGQDQFLEPYQAGEEAVFSGIAALQETVSDNPAQVARLAEAEEILREWQANAVEPAIDLRRRIGDAETMNDMADLVSEERGKVYFDRFRDQIATFIEREVVLLGERREAFEAAMAEVNENLSLLRETTGWVDHTNRVLADASRLLADAVDMETGYRGFMLAGDDVFLTPFTGGREAFFTGIAALQETVSDNPPQVERLQDIEATVQEWLDQVVEPGLAMRRDVERDRATLEDIDGYVSRRQGMQYFDAMRAALAVFIEVENDLMVQRQAAAEEADVRNQELLTVLSENEAWVTHTYHVIDQANAILASAVDMETGMRGFLLAGRETFLEPYNSGGERFSSLVADLSETVSDNPAQVTLLGEIAATIGEWRDEVVEPMIDLRRAIGDAETMDDMADLVGEERGKIFFDSFRAVMADFRAEELALMDVRQASNEETSSFANSMAWILMMAGIAVGGGLAWLIGNGIARPISNITKAMDELAGGNKSVDIPGVGRRDEIGEMAGAVQVFKENAIKVDRMQVEQAEAEKRAEQEKRAAMNKLADDFESSVGHIVDTVGTAAGQMQSTAESMSSIADKTSSQSTTVAAAAEQATSNVQTVASATEQLSSSIQEISRQVQRQSEIAAQAADAAGQSRQQVGDLSDQAQSIGEVVSLITSIAEQTNLLALNATIEAARAGDAGKGFAVVASEVKNLANQTAKATEEIAGQIKGVQERTSSTVSAIERITETIQSMTEIASVVAAAVEEQNAATQEIGRNVQQAATGTQQVSSAITDVTHASSEAGSASTQVLGSARDMSKQATDLSEQVNRFLGQVRAA